MTKNLGTQTRGTRGDDGKQRFHSYPSSPSLINYGSDYIMPCRSDCVLAGLQHEINAVVVQRVETERTVDVSGISPLPPH